MKRDKFEIALNPEFEATPRVEIFDYPVISDMESPLKIRISVLAVNSIVELKFKFRFILGDGKGRSCA